MTRYGKGLSVKLTLWLTGDWNGQGVDGEGTNGDEGENYFEEHDDRDCREKEQITAAPGLRFWRWKRRTGVGYTAAEETGKSTSTLLWISGTRRCQVQTHRLWGGGECTAAGPLPSWMVVSAHHLEGDTRGAIAVDALASLALLSIRGNWIQPTGPCDHGVAFYEPDKRGTVFQALRGFDYSPIHAWRFKLTVAGRGYKRFAYKNLWSLNGSKRRGSPQVRRAFLGKRFGVAQETGALQSWGARLRPRLSCPSASCIMYTLSLIESEKRSKEAHRFPEDFQGLFRGQSSSLTG